MTNLEVIDSAVKIGLGALIGAGSTIAVTLLQARAERKRELRKRRLDVLEKSARDFEKATMVFTKLHATYRSYIKPPPVPENVPAAKLAVAQVRGQIWEKTWAIIANEVQPNLISLHEVEAVLHLVGSVEASRIVEAIRIAATDLQSMPACLDWPVKHDLPTIEIWDKKGVEIGAARIRFYNQLREDFDSV